MDALQNLQSMGLSLPSPAALWANLLFSIIGFVIWRMVRRRGRSDLSALAWAIMLYPMLVSDTLWLYLIGGALCVIVYLRWRD